MARSLGPALLELGLHFWSYVPLSPCETPTGELTGELKTEWAAPLTIDSMVFVFAKDTFIHLLGFSLRELYSWTVRRGREAESPTDLEELLSRVWNGHFFLTSVK